MAGYGNKRASFPDMDEPESHPHFDIHRDSDQSSNPPRRGSSSIGSAGYGNKLAPVPIHDDNDEPFRFGSHMNTEPYSGSNEYGSGTTGGAGWGNKTGTHGESSDSTMGKLMQKAGSVIKSEKMIEKGAKMREDRGFVGGVGGGGEIQGGVNGEGARAWNE